MKKFFLFLGVIFMTTFFFCSCDDTGIENESPYKLNIYGNSYNLTQAIMWQGNPNSTYLKKDYKWQETYENEEGETVTDDLVGFQKGEKISTGNFRLNLYDDGITYTSTTNSYLGAGTIVSIHFASETLTEIKPGKYAFNENKAAGTFLGYVATNYEFTGENQQIVSISEGEVDVAKTASGYKIAINAKTAAGIPLTANYEGEMDMIKKDQSQEVFLSGLYLGSHLDSIFVTVYFFGDLDSEEFSLDSYSKACLSVTRGEVSTAGDSDTKGNESVHIAAKFDEAQNRIVIISPTKMRARMGHDDDYLYTCHTRYKRAVGMTDAEFAAFDVLTIPDLSDQDEEVSFSVDNFEPGFFYFEAGDGTIGLVRVKAMLPPKDCVDVLMGVIETRYTIQEQLIIDIKSTTNYGNPKI